MDHSEVSLISESSRIQFSVGTLLGAISLTCVVMAGVYQWHRWLLWNTTPYGDPSAQWFVDSRQHMFDWTTPILTAFILVASFAIWYVIAHRDCIESLIGGLALSFPILMPLGPLAIACVFIPLATPIAGCWLLFKRRFLLGGVVVLFAVSWLFFIFYYLDDWFAIYGD